MPGFEPIKEDVRENHGSSFDNSSHAMMKTMELKSVNLQGSIPRNSQPNSVLNNEDSARQFMPTEKNLDQAVVQVPSLNVGPEGADSYQQYKVQRPTLKELPHEIIPNSLSFA